MKNQFISPSQWNKFPDPTAIGAKVSDHPMEPHNSNHKPTQNNNPDFATTAKKRHIYPNYQQNHQKLRNKTCEEDIWWQKIYWKYNFQFLKLWEDNKILHQLAFPEFWILKNAPSQKGKKNARSFSLTLILLKCQCEPKWVIRFSSRKKEAKPVVLMHGPVVPLLKKKSETCTKQGGESPERLNKLFYLAIWTIKENLWCSWLFEFCLSIF